MNTKKTKDEGLYLLLYSLIHSSLFCNLFEVVDYLGGIIHPQVASQPTVTNLQPLRGWDFVALTFCFTNITLLRSGRIWSGIRLLQI